VLPADGTAALQNLRRAGRLVVLTGAGVSAESGIPTFRGDDGYWTAGSRNYQPMDLATCAAFRRRPEVVWAWYLYRLGVCRSARPNAAHRALVAVERALGERFRLVTQNVDGLHLRAGSDPARLWHIHGSLERVRCADGCGQPPRPTPAVPMPWPRHQPLDAATARALRCSCGGWLRPHVLWFDEYYDEANFHFDSALTAAARADLLIVVGSSGATNLPMHMAALCAQRGIPRLLIDPEHTAFHDIHGAGAGWTLRAAATAALPWVAAQIAGSSPAGPPVG